MTEQQIDLRDPRVLHRAAEHLTERYAGVFFPELVQRCLIDCHTDLARRARLQSYLMPMALHDAADRLRALAQDKGSRRERVCQVLFVEDHDTGPAAVAAALLATYAGIAVVTRSAGTTPGTTLDPAAVQVLAGLGVDPAAVAPKPLTDSLLAAADWVIVFGAPDVGPLESGTRCQHWPVDGAPGTDPGPGFVADLQSRVQALWLEITAGTATGPAAQLP
ncbi:low molecular weight phosphatase family protein [Kocuria dechangensis]|uniref:Low molecular weight phosphatase family protein n=1 Tax=Kocuria dechangensis TaxID=1176249 RepID=A0A917H9I2_9MICC|nr:arsenate reductase ArsC [Kocuria dechangensis]GGG72302.1 low molecular weight phosphatase family protein [Kocuria dechangensis]